MTRAWLIIAALGGFLSVVAGGAAAHLPAGERAAQLLRTGAIYGSTHAAALVAVVALARLGGSRGSALAIARWGFAVGIALFSTSLFALALTGSGWFGMITPFGGVGLLVGWAALATHAWRS